MPTPLVRRIDLDKLYPDFLQSALEVLATCQKAGAHYYAISGFRSFEEQDRLFAQGRTVPGKKVTQAKGGQSLHNFGLAIDVCRDANLVAVDLQPAWDHAGYEALFREAGHHKLETGFFWKFSDPGHLQLPRPPQFKTDGEWMAELKDIHDAKGLVGVWMHLKATYPSLAV